MEEASFDVQQAGSEPGNSSPAAVPPTGTSTNAQREMTPDEIDRKIQQRIEMAMDEYNRRQQSLRAKAQARAEKASQGAIRALEGQIGRRATAEERAEVVEATARALAEEPEEAAPTGSPASQPAKPGIVPPAQNTTPSKDKEIADAWKSYLQTVYPSIQVTPEEAVELSKARSGMEWGKKLEVILSARHSSQQAPTVPAQVAQPTVTRMPTMGGGGGLPVGTPNPIASITDPATLIKMGLTRKRG